MIDSLSESPIQLRGYQQKVVAEAYQQIKRGFKSLLIVAIMGAGKTIIAAWMMRDAVNRGRRVVFLVALNVLLDQTAETLQALGVPCTILQGDRPVDPSAPVLIASMQTIASRLRQGKTVNEILGDYNLVFVDEAHVTAFHSVYDEVTATDPDVIKIGLTATPWRLSKQEWLGQKFAALIEGPQPPDIIKLGGAVPCRGFTLIGAIDITKLHVRNGDFIDSEIASQATRTEALDHVFTEWQRLCSGRPTLMIGATVAQAELTRDRFIDGGVAAEVIVGSTSHDERLAIFDRMKQGQTQVICSVGCLTAGFNLPIISAILYIRATKSQALFFQSAGRGSRPAPSKSDYLLLDFGGNLKRFGNPMGWQQYDIDEPEQADNALPTKTCPQCSAEISMFARICPECGFEFQGEALTEEDREQLILAQLNEFVDRFTREKIANARRWRKEAWITDRSPDEASERFVEAYGHTPPAEWLLHACLTKRNSSRRRALFLDYLKRHSRASKWQNQWTAHHLRLEFGVEALQTSDPVGEWWEVLGLPASADWQAIKCRYQELLLEFEHDPPEIERLNNALEDASDDLAIELQSVEVGA